MCVCMSVQWLYGNIRLWGATKFIHFPRNDNSNLEYSKASITPTKELSRKEIRTKTWHVSICIYVCVCVPHVPVETNDIRAKVESVSKSYSLATKNYSKIIVTRASFLLPMSPISHRVRTYRSMRISDPCTSKRKTQIGTCNQSSGSSRSLTKDLMKEGSHDSPQVFNQNVC